MSSPLKLIVGLGNPGPRYEQTRHNAGFWFADLLAERAGGRFAMEAKFQGELVRIVLVGDELRLLKPQTFMNLSGQSAGAVARFFKLAPEQVLVAHDELDLPPGTARLKRGGGHGGHNGLRDLIRHIGADFWRLRVGIGHPGHRDQVTDYVLTRAPAAEETLIRESLAEAADAVEQMLSQGAERAMHQLHSRGVQARPYRKPEATGG
ncbi:MAG: aminoacyl-tRNA hydrolase [Gammaproteobacteria bacterium]|nr:MAG: aminoacyl-tRNA hydrolase [Gammaproteobacteria bacterium]